MNLGVFAAIKLGDKGGIENVMKFLNDSFIEKGINVVLFLPFKNIIRKKHTKLKVSILPPFFSVLAKNNFKIIDFLLAIYFGIILKFYKVDLIHVHSIFPYGVILARIKSMLKIKYCISFHGGDIQVVEEINYGIRLNKVTDSLIRESILSFDLFFAPSKNIRDLLIEMGINSEKIKVIYHGYSNKQIKKFSNINLTKLKKKMIFLSVGRNHLVKGYKFALDALTLIKSGNFIYRIVGRNTSSLKEYADEIGICDKVEFINEVEHDKVIELMHSSDVLLLPSYSEGFPLVKSEAFSCGLPVVTTDAQGCTDMIINNYNGIITKRETCEYAKAIQTLIVNNVVLEKMKNGALETASSLSWDAISKKYISNYYDLLRNYSDVL